jgi:alkylhydroperoxidase family enzyme
VAWIETTREDEWDGQLAQMYGSVVDREHGRVDNIMQIHSLDPEAMGGHLGVYSAAMSSTRTLRKVERELIALLVSDNNDCHY